MQEVNESLGAYLKRAREEKNVSIEQVAYATRISLKMLRALEEDQHTLLPAPTFIRGYLQAYAKYVRLDTQDLMLRYQHHLATAPDSKRGAIRSHYLYVRERYQEKRRLVLVIVLFTTMLSVAGAYFFLKAQRDKHKRVAKAVELIQRSDEQRPLTPFVVDVDATKAANRAEAKEAMKEGAKESAKAAATADKSASPEKPTKPATETAAAEKTAAPKPAPAPEKVEKAEKPEKAASPKPAPAPAVEPAAPAAPQATTQASGEKKAFVLQLRAQEDVWFRFQNDQGDVKDLTLRAGKTMVLRADKVIKIFSGNLGGLKANLNGTDIPALAATKATKSVVLPESEAPNYKLPLFPQFQPKPAPKVSAAPQQEAAPTPTPAENSAPPITNP